MSWCLIHAHRFASSPRRRHLPRSPGPIALSGSGWPVPLVTCLRSGREGEWLVLSFGQQDLRRAIENSEMKTKKDHVSRLEFCFIASPTLFAAQSAIIDAVALIGPIEPPGAVSLYPQAVLLPAPQIFGLLGGCALLTLCGWVGGRKVH